MDVRFILYSNWLDNLYENWLSTITIFSHGCIRPENAADRYAENMEYTQY